MLKRNDHDCHECEVLGSGPEAVESEYAWKNCAKNPGHTNFIPVTEFSSKHLPFTHQKTEFSQVVKQVCDRTVRLRVAFTSFERPDGYPLSALRGSKLPHYGSGYVDDIVPGMKLGPCPLCKNSPSPCQKWYKVDVMTACHVVYNSEEAAATTADLFYDDKTSMADGGVKTIAGLEVYTTDKLNDYCYFTCVAHDEDIAMRLEPVIRKSKLMLKSSWKNINSEPPRKRLTVAVSHPHGQPKKVTVGSEVRIKVLEFDRPRPGGGIGRMKRGEYTTDTCPGSSGAPVITYVPHHKDTWAVGHWLSLAGLAPPEILLKTHSGFNEDENVNFSTASALF